MDQAGVVGMGQSLGGLADVLGGHGGLQRAVPLDHLLQVAALDVLHHQVMDIPHVIDVVGPHDIAVVQGGGRLGLADGSGPGTRCRRRGWRAAP